MSGARGYGWAAAGLAIGCVLLLWPGVATFDTLSQYAQAVSGRYDDWHPPIMARLWSLMLAGGLAGTGPMLALQSGVYWAGFALIAAAFARARRPGLGGLALAIGLLPPVFGWMIAVLKDCELIAALVAATGIVAWHRLGRRPLGIAARLGVGSLLVYAALARANSVFGVVPLALAWSGWFGLRRIWARALLTGVAVLAMIGVSGPINHGLFGAERSDVERTLPLFDMAGIAHRVPLATIPQLPPAQWAAAERRGCYTPFYWDPYTDATKCGWVATAVALDRDEDAPSIFGDWAKMVAAHPLAYAAHRIAHLNSTLRVAMPARERLATAPPVSLAAPPGVGWPARRAAGIVARISMAVDETPLGAPWVWLVLAGGLWWTLAGAPVGPARDLGLASALSACLQTASFAVVSIASDLRYHLWLIEGTALAVLFAAASAGLPRVRLAATTAMTAAACLLSALLRGGALAGV